MNKSVKKFIIISVVSAMIVQIFPSVRISAEKSYLPDSIYLADYKKIDGDITVGKIDDGKSLDECYLYHPANKETIFSFVSDDGASNDYLYRDIFANRNVACTVPIVGNYLASPSDSASVITLNQALALQNKYGYEIASHSFDHIRLSSISDDLTKLESQFTQSIEFFNGVGLNVENLFLPFDDYNDTVLECASKYFNAVRTSDIGVNDPFDSKHLKTY